jgi:hypothetical protein
MEKRVLLPYADIGGSTANIEAGCMNHLSIKMVAEIVCEGNGFGLKTTFTTILYEQMIEASDRS